MGNLFNEHQKIISFALNKKKTYTSELESLFLFDVMN